MRRTQQPRRGRLSPAVRKRILIGIGIAVGIFVVANIILWIMYQNRTYPRTEVMNAKIGSVAYSDLGQKVSEQKLLPEEIKLTHDKQNATARLGDLGITKDVTRTVDGAKKQRSWLPVLNLFKSPKLQAPIKVDTKKFTQKTNVIAQALRQDATDAKLTLNGTTVGIAEAKNGYELNKAILQKSITTMLDKGNDSLDAPTTVTTPKIAAKDLEDDKTAVEGQIATQVTFKYEGKTKTASAADVAKWLIPSGSTYVVSADAVRTYVSSVGTSFGIRIKDVNAAVDTTTQAVSKAKTTTVTLTAQIAVKTYTYCVAAKGVSTSNLPALKSKLQTTYGDTRGWSLGGLVEYKEVSSGCSFTVWLSAAELMPTFGAICDSMWSCRVGPNVVINFDRWQNASPSWNANGGTLAEYRSMVINHETGHWLGFGHDHCPGAGQAAPVMQQQSINLQGCTFSPWPNAKELGVLRTRLGI